MQEMMPLRPIVPPKKKDQNPEQFDKIVGVLLQDPKYCHVLVKIYGTLYPTQKREIEQKFHLRADDDFLTTCLKLSIAQTAGKNPDYFRFLRSNFLRDSHYEALPNRDAAAFQICQKRRLPKLISLIKRLNDHIESSSAGEICALGIGNGYLIEYLANNRPDVPCIGVDISTKHIILNKKRRKFVKYFEDDIFVFVL